jgi:hypothetical protein
MNNAIKEQLSHFRFDHLPEHLQAVSAPFCLQAVHLVRTVGSGPGVTRALGHLRRAKDEAVTAKLNAGKSPEEFDTAAHAVIDSADEWLAKNDSPFMMLATAP